jgi:hypothetical protein
MKNRRRNCRIDEEKSDPVKHDDSLGNNDVAKGCREFYEDLMRGGPYEDNIEVYGREWMDSNANEHDDDEAKGILFRGK